MLIIVFKYYVFIFASIDIVRQCFLWIPSTISQYTEWGTKMLKSTSGKHFNEKGP